MGKNGNMRVIAATAQFGIAERAVSKAMEQIHSAHVQALKLGQYEIAEEHKRHVEELRPLHRHLQRSRDRLKPHRKKLKKAPPPEPDLHRAPAAVSRDNELRAAQAAQEPPGSAKAIQGGASRSSRQGRPKKAGKVGAKKKGKEHGAAGIASYKGHSFYMRSVAAGMAEFLSAPATPPPGMEGYCATSGKRAWTNERVVECQLGSCTTQCVNKAQFDPVSSRYGVKIETFVQAFRACAVAKRGRRSWMDFDIETLRECENFSTLQMMSWFYEWQNDIEALRYYESQAADAGVPF
jgi:hypothetical protein